MAKLLEVDNLKKQNEKLLILFPLKLLKLTLIEAKNIGLNKVYLGAYTGNIGSWKVMEKCGGIYENTITEKETGLPVKRYCIEIK